MNNYEFFDPDGDQYFTLLDGHPEVGRSVTTLRRYAAQGVVIHGQRIKLRVCRAPIALATTLTEWRRFISRCSRAEAEAQQVSPGLDGSTGGGGAALSE